MVDAAKKMGVKHLIYSTLDAVEPKAPHWVTKSEVDGIPRPLSVQNP